MLAGVVAFFSSAKYWIYIGVTAIAVLLLTLLRYRKDKITQLQYEMHFMKAKREIDKIAAKHNVAVGELMPLRERDLEVEGKLSKLEACLLEQTKPYMTSEEIARKFREIGIR